WIPPDHGELIAPTSFLPRAARGRACPEPAEGMKEGVGRIQFLHMEARTDGAGSSAAAGTNKNRIFGFELRAARRSQLLPRRPHGRINRSVQWLDPTGSLLIAYSGDHQQVARPRRGDVSHACTFRLVAQQFLVLVLKQIRRRAASKADRTNPTLRIDA